MLHLNVQAEFTHVLDGMALLTYSAAGHKNVVLRCSGNSEKWSHSILDLQIVPCANDLNIS